MSSMDMDIFSEEDIEAATTWTLMTEALIASAPEINRERLKQAVQNLSAKCNDSWLEIEHGEQVEFTAEDLGVDLTGIDDNVAVSFAGHTAICLLAGIDGPHITATVLCEGIDTLADEIEGK